MCCKCVVKYNSPYLYSPSVLIKPEMDIFNPNFISLHVPVNTEQSTFLTVNN